MITYSRWCQPGPLRRQWQHRQLLEHCLQGCIEPVTVVLLLACRLLACNLVKSGCIVDCCMRPRSCKYMCMAQAAWQHVTCVYAEPAEQLLRCNATALSPSAFLWCCLPCCIRSCSALRWAGALIGTFKWHARNRISNRYPGEMPSETPPHHP
jgi:hypothetical protein